ncbi:MAG: HAD-IA family hydrolase [Clostridia bacterium]|nr:HAD-IA family hydrolase [Clostridia bacterium]
MATKQRIEWAGLSPDDFEFYTTYENSCRCKPNSDYYREILNKLQVNPAECLMVGNDVEEDMVAESIGMKVFLMTDWLINRSGIDVSRYPNGGFAELKKFLETL